jgi:hypothetical protein
MGKWRLWVLSLLYLFVGTAVFVGCSGSNTLAPPDAPTPTYTTDPSATLPSNQQTAAAGNITLTAISDNSTATQAANTATAGAPLTATVAFQAQQTANAQVTQTAVANALNPGIGGI